MIAVLYCFFRRTFLETTLSRWLLPGSSSWSLPKLPRGFIDLEVRRGCALVPWLWPHCWVSALP